MTATGRRYRVRITGIVQGVGFRPFLHRLAAERSLGGWAKNAGGAVVAEIEGDPEECAAFLRDIEEKAPDPAVLRRINVEEIGPVSAPADFKILPSDRQSGLERFLPVDIGICDECRSELADALDRRYEYPFINCCRCGPRYTIVRELPYDRERTSMRSFHLCLDCRCEYEFEEDRRYHAEPNACWECGPQYTFLDDEGQSAGRNALDAAVGALGAGRILAVKGVGGFHLVCDATAPEAVERLRLLKRRPKKPLAVMVANLEMARALGIVGDREAKLLQGDDRPILLARRAPAAGGEDRGPRPRLADISPGLNTIGLMLPYAAVQVLLLERLDRPLVYTSANTSGGALTAENTEARETLKKMADGWLLHDRRIANPCDDSVVRAAGEVTVTIRGGRGRAPHAVPVEGRYPAIIACGSDLKASVCLADRGWAHIGPHIGDLADATCAGRYEETIAKMSSLLRIEPRLAACDSHPDFISTDFARGLGLPLVEVQHHHAHIAAVMAERQLSGPVIGVAFDGLGWGDDGALWGGEWLVCDRSTYRRAAHLREIVLPGGDAPARYPWRTAVSHLRAIGLGPAEIAGLLPGLDPARTRAVIGQLEQGINTVRTSSVGRLFEAVAAVVLGEKVQSYEGRSASVLEALSGTVSGAYRFVLAEKGDSIEVDARRVWSELLADIEAGASKAEISSRFHQGLAVAIVDVASRLRERDGLEDVVLAGGVFVNSRLLTAAVRRLGKAGFTIHVPEKIAINDGGISLGQAVVAAERTRRRAI